MKTVYLHIGTHKTGTTSIQNFLYHNRKILMQKGFYFPVSGYEKGHCHLAWELSQQTKLFDKQYGGWDDLVQELSQCKQNKIILSSECFSSYSEHNIELLKERLTDYNIKIIVFLRSQDSFFKSRYFEIVRSGQVVNSFEKFLSKRLSLGGYYKIISRWEVYFDKENIMVHKYNPNQIIEDFLNILEVPREGFEKTDIRLNQSINWNSLVILRLLNKYFFKFMPIQKRMKVSELILNNTIFLRLTRHICLEAEPSAQSVLSLFKESNKRLEEQYGVNLYNYEFQEEQH